MLYTETEKKTYSEAAHEDHCEALQYSGTPDHPGVSDEHHQTEDVLNRRKVDAEHHSELCFLQQNVHVSPTE